MSSRPFAKASEEILRIAKELLMPVDAVTERIAFVGQSGSGKTYAAMRLAELMLELGAQIVALDPMGVWWGLLSAANGKASGFPVHVFGGKHAHVPIVPEGGALVADVIVQKQISAVIDLSLFTKAEQVQFAIAFAERFFKLQVEAQRPVHLFLEEAQTFMPQNLPPEGRGGDPKKNPAVMLNRMELLVRQGRSQGIGCSMITQAPQAVAKSCLNQVGTLFAMRTLGKHERKAISDWMADKATDDSQLKLDQLLPKLGTGEAWVASPHFLGSFTHAHITQKTTFDSSSTPRFGVRLEAPKVLAAVDVAALREAMKTVVERVEGDDPAALKREIARLKAELAKKPAAAAEKVEVKVSIKEELKQLQSTIEVIAKIGDQLAQKQQVVVSALENATTKLKPTFERPMQKLEVRPPPGVLVRQLAKHAAPPASLDGVKLSGKATEILREMVALHPEHALTRDVIAMRAGLRNNGNFRNYMSELRTAGLIDQDVDVPTDAGRSVAVGAAPKTFTELRAQWGGLLSGKAARMLDLLVEAGQRKTRDELAAAVELENNGNFRNYMSELNTAALIVEDRGSGAIASPALFLGGT